MSQEEPNVGGRPRAIIDWEIVDELLIAGCSGASIALELGLYKSTIYERCVVDKGITFSEYAHQKKEKGNNLLRKVQFNKAVAGDNSMLIWLGKNRLEQSDSPTEVSVSSGTVKEFSNLMQTLQNLQSAARNSADNSINIDVKSE